MGKSSKTENPRQQDDLWGWVLIALILAAVSIVLYGPLIWEIAHGA
jgi:hypothetical protein